MQWTYSKHLHRRTTIEGVAQAFLSTLRSLVTHCCSRARGVVRPPTTPLATLTQAQVNQLVGTGREVKDLYPLSPMQQGMLFHTLRDLGSGVYVGPAGFRVPAGLRVGAFQAAWREVLARHALLRSAVVWEGLEEPLQLVRRGVELPWEEQDLRALPAREQEAWLDAYLAQDRARGFALGSAPLLRLTLLRLSEEAYQVLWSFHHLLLDGWSLPLLLEELLACYEAAGAHKPFHGPRSVPIGTISPGCVPRSGGRLEAFWRQALRGFQAPTRLPVQRARSQGVPSLSAPSAPAAPREQERRLTRSSTEALEKFARSQGLTLSTVLQGAWGLLLGRTSGERETLHGTTVSGRTAPLDGIERMLGLFINTVPVRVRVEEEQTVAAWLSKLQESQLEQRAHEHSALWEIQAWSELPRGVGLFESLLVVENYPVDRALGERFGSLSIGEVRQTERTNYPLTVVALPGRELGLRLSYTEALYEDATIERLLGALQTLLEGLVAEPACRVSEALAADGRRAAKAACHVERDGKRVPERGEHPRSVRGPSRADPRGRGRRLRGSIPQLSGAQPPCQSAGTSPARPRSGSGKGRRGGASPRDQRGSRSGGGAVHGAVAGDGGGAAGHPEGRWCLRAAGSGYPGSG